MPGGAGRQLVATAKDPRPASNSSEAFEDPACAGTPLPCCCCSSPSRLRRRSTAVWSRGPSWTPARGTEPGQTAPTLSWEHVQTLRTGADGAAEVRGLRPGDYCAFLATVPAPYSSWRNAGAASTALAHYAKPLSLAGAAPRAQIDFVVGAGSELAGRFAMSDGSAPPQRHGVTVDFTSSPQVGGF